MDNYKILYKGDDDMEVKLELLNQLGFQNIGMSDEGSKEWLFTYDNSDFYQAIKDENFAEIKELTLPQLRDLVVLKRNDVKDATHQDKYDASLKYVYLNGEWYEWINGWMAGCINPAKLTPITQPQDSALISGAEALADITNVQHAYDDRDVWYNTQYSTLTIPEILKSETSDGRKIIFRIKPQTIKLELELPKPFEPKDGERYFYLNPHADAGYGENTTTKWNKYLQFGAWRTEDEIKQVVEQLRKIRGTNS